MNGKNKPEQKKQVGTERNTLCAPVVYMVLTDLDNQTVKQRLWVRLGTRTEMNNKIIVD